MSTRPRALTAAAAVAATALLGGLLTGCGTELAADVHPGRAAVVGDEDLRLDEVDDFADELCAMIEPDLTAERTALPMAYVRAVSLRALLESSLAEQFGQEQDYNLDAARRAATDRAEQQVPLTGPGQRDTFVRFLSLQEFVNVVVASAGGAEPGADGDQEAALARGREIFDAWREDVEVSVDPRYGAIDFATGEFTSAPGSASVNVSGGLTDQAGDEFDQDYVSSLPDEQRCG